MAKQRGNQGWNPHMSSRKISLACLHCKVQFTSYPSLNRKYCSVACKAKALAYITTQHLPHPTKESHYNWKGGISSEDKLERQRFRVEVVPLVLARDNYTCQICYAYGVAMHADHIKGWADYPELRFEPSNCRTLCIPCHYYVTFKRKMPIGTAWGLPQRSKTQ